MRYKVTEKVTGKVPNKSIGFIVLVCISYIFTLPFRMLTQFTKGYNEVNNNDWEYIYWSDDLKITKRIIAATGFDDCIPFYYLMSTDENLNKVLKEKYFSNFIIKTTEGIFLREFKSPKSWPNSRLIFIPFENYQIEIIAKSNSSWPDWTYKFVNQNQIDIITEYTNEYTKILQIKKL